MYLKLKYKNLKKKNTLLVSSAQTFRVELTDIYDRE